MKVLEQSIKADFTKLEKSTKTDMAEFKESTKTDMAEFKESMKTDMAEFKESMKVSLQMQDLSMKANFEKQEQSTRMLRKEMKEGFARADNRMDRQFNYLNEGIDKTLIILGHIQKELRGELKDHEKRITRLEKAIA